MLKKKNKSSVIMKGWWKERQQNISFLFGEVKGVCAVKVCRHSPVNLWLKYTNVTAFPFFFHSIRGFWSFSVLNSQESTASGRTENSSNFSHYLLLLHVVLFVTTMYSWKREETHFLCSFPHVFSMKWHFHENTLKYMFYMVYCH